MSAGLDMSDFIAIHHLSKTYTAAKLPQNLRCFFESLFNFTQRAVRGSFIEEIFSKYHNIGFSLSSI